MPPMNLRIKFLGRPIKPVAFGLALTMFVISWAAYTNTGVLGISALADILGDVSLLVGAALCYGWFLNSQEVAEGALLAAFFVWVTRAFLIVLVNGNPITQEGFFLSIGWCVIAGGAYLLEKADSLTNPPRRKWRT